MEQEIPLQPRPPQVGECLSVGWERFQEQMGMLILIIIVFAVVLILAEVVGMHDHVEQKPGIAPQQENDLPEDETMIVCRLIADVEGRRQRHIAFARER